MLNETQTSYMIAKYLAKYSSEDLHKNPLISIEAYGYLCAIIDSTDSKDLRAKLRKRKEELFTEIYARLAIILEGKSYDEL